MKNQIRVYLQYPWKFPDSPYYKYLIDNPPEDVKYFNVEKQKGVIINKTKFLFSNWLKKTICKSFNLLKISLPNAHKSPKGDYDLIHCAHCLSKNKDKPWVADIESEWQLYIGNKAKSVKNKVKEILLRENCKKILPWTKATANEIIKEFPEIKDKVEVVYPAVPLLGEKKKHKGINLLFVGRYFYQKGGLHALKAIDELTKKYQNVNGIFISEVPKEILNKYRKNKKIKFYNLMPQKQLFDLYSISDIFIYPGYSDSFGFAYLEAMSFGIPVITVDGFARKEIIQERKTGFIVKRRGFRWYPEEKEVNYIIEELVKKASLMIKNKKLREKMSKNCIKIIKEGKFSMKERNKKLKKIYEEALKK